MITSRYIQPEDWNLLETSLVKDEYHKETPIEFFSEEGTVCSVYEDEDGPICFVRGKPVIHECMGIIQLDIQYIDNNDARRNLKAMVEGFPILEQNAKENGFIGFFFVSSAPLLRKFCIKRLGFKEFGEHYLVKAFYDSKEEQ